MAVQPIPEGYHSVTPYLIVEDVKGQIEFLKKVFDAEERYQMPDQKGRIMHAEVKVGDSIIMMGESMEEFPPLPCMLYLYVEDVDAVYQKALDAGAKSLQEPADQFYGDRNAGISGPSDIRWWISTHVEDVSDEEMKRRHEEYAKAQS